MTLHLREAPAVLLGVVSFFYLTDQPSKATWLQPEQQKWLEAKLAAESLAKGQTYRQTPRQALTSSKVLPPSFIYFGVLAGLFWLPQIVKAFGMTNVETRFVSALPFGDDGQTVRASGSGISRFRCF